MPRGRRPIRGASEAGRGQATGLRDTGRADTTARNRISAGEMYGEWGYRYEAATVEGFVQQLAVSYLKNGYWHYVRGEVPEGKDPRRVDEKILLKYGIARSKWAKYRDKGRGAAKLQYLRYRTTFLLLKTPHPHPVFD